MKLKREDYKLEIKRNKYYLLILSFEALEFQTYNCNMIANGRSISQCHYTNHIQIESLGWKRK